MKGKMLAGLIVGALLMTGNGASGVSAATITFDFEGGGPGTATTQGYKAYGFGDYFLWSGGSAVSVAFSQASGDQIDLSFYLAIIDSWDGNNATWGPDYFNVTLDGQSIFRETFTHSSLSGQTYTGTPLFHGINVARNTSWPDAAYQITLSGLASSPGTHTLAFFANGSGWQGGSDESFAIDNIVISYRSPGNEPAPVPEPATVLLFGTGLASLAGLSRRGRGKESA